MGFISVAKPSLGAAGCRENLNKGMEERGLLLLAVLCRYQGKAFTREERYGVHMSYRWNSINKS